MRIVVTRRIPEEGLALLRRIGTVEVYTHDKIIPRAELLKRIHGANAALTLLTEKVDAEFFEAAGSSLKIVANYAVGFDNIDIREANKHGVVITNTPGVLTEAVAEHTLALMFAVARRVVESDAFMRTGQYTHWLPLGFLGQSLWGKTLGIIGLGRIGTWVAEAAHRGLNMQILYHDSGRSDELEMKLNAEYHELDVLLRKSDIVTLHVPLTDETQHLIGERELSKMKPTAILINTARGPVVDEQALYHSLHERKIFGAGLDVFEHEPKLYHGLEKLPNVVLTPHIASATNEARQAMAEIAARNIIEVLAGRPPLNPIKSES
ncbi:D-glycerate dehydrogenase [Candidatus Berkelbacteria bacterium]|nr:D-glycerate dehydrogenase [Candidatus Berkelbacteria bacterium]